VIDTFYVTDLTGHKIESPTRVAAIRERLVATLSGEAAASARPAQGAAGRERAAVE